MKSRFKQIKIIRKNNDLSFIDDMSIALCTQFHLILTTTLQGRCHYFHFYRLGNSGSKKLNTCSRCLSKVTQLISCEARIQTQVFLTPKPKLVICELLLYLRVGHCCVRRASRAVAERVAGARATLPAPARPGGGLERGHGCQSLSALDRLTGTNRTLLARL